MDNSSYRDQYMKLLTSGNLAEQSLNVLYAFWKRVAAAESEIGKTIEDGYSESDYTALLEKLNVTNVNVMRTYKSRIKSYLEWLCKNGVIGEERILVLKQINYGAIDNARVLDDRYFPTLSALQEYIDDCVDSAQRLDDNVFAMQISALYLVWYGVSIDELMRIKKSDVHQDRIDVGNRVIIPAPSVMDYIIDYRFSNGYSSQANQIIFLKYAPSGLLFRTAKSPCITSTTALHTAIRTLAKYGEKSARSLTYEKVYWSGIFNRAYQYELSNGPIPQNNVEIKEQIFNESYESDSIANRRLAEYRQFQEHFFPSQHKSDSKHS